MAYLAVKQFGADKFEIVTPSISILAEPPVAVVDKAVGRHGTRDVAETYLQFLHSPQGQEVAASSSQIGSWQFPMPLAGGLLSGVETVTNDEAFVWGRRLAHEEGILVGISAGANVAAATRVAARPENRGKVIVTVATSFGERYLSTPLYQDASQPSPAA